MRRTCELSSKRLENHVGEAHSTSASMKGACESAPVGVMLGNVALLLHFYLTAKMEDFIAKLKQFSKLDFQSKREMINNGRPMPELQGMLQVTGQKIIRSFQTGCVAVLQETAFTAFPVIFSQRVTMSGLNETGEVCLSAVGPICKMTITICKLLDR